MHTGVSVHGCVYVERERISVTLVTTAAQGCLRDLYMCACACVFRHYSANLTIFTRAQYLRSQPRETHTLTEAMKARQKRRVPGLTTGCCTTQAACIEEKQRVSQPAVRYAQRNKKKMNKYMHEHTKYIFGMYDCMRSESESALSGMFNKTNKQTCTRILVCLRMSMCMSESESASHSSPPLLKGV
jgi:hypothetical protein